MMDQKGQQHTDSSSIEEKVLQLTFPYLDLSSLYAARLVSCVWNAKAIEAIKAKFRFDLDFSNKENCSKLIKSLNNSYVIKFQSLEAEIKLGPLYDLMRKIFPIIGPSLEELTINFESSGIEYRGSPKISFSSKDIDLVLNKCPNLETLNLIPDYYEHCQETFTIMESKKTLQSITKFSLHGFVDEDGNFCGCDDKKYFAASEILFFPLAQRMPNLRKIDIRFVMKREFSSFLEKLKRLRANGNLWNVKHVSFDGNGWSDDDLGIPLTHEHLKLLTEMKGDLEVVKLSDFNFAKLVLQTYIPEKTFFNFFKRYRTTLNSFTLISSSEKKQIETLKFPVMNDLQKFKIMIKGAADSIPKEKLLKWFPKLLSLGLDAEWENKLHLERPYFERRSKLESIWLTIFPEEGQSREEKRVIELQHEAIDYSFSNQKFLANMLTCHSGIKKISATIEIHLGLVNLLTGLCKTEVEELQLELRCLYRYCDKDIANDEKTPTSQDNSSNIFFPELRALNISGSGCKKLNLDYMLNSGVLNKLATYTIIDNTKMPGRFTITYRK